jgi:hypothetical protein
MALPGIEWLLVALELAVVATAAVKIRQIVRTYRRERPRVLFAPDALEASLLASLRPRGVATLLSTELTLPYYAVAAWFKKPHVDAGHGTTFTHHQRAGYGAIVLAIGVAVVAETLAAHFILRLWSPVAAWGPHRPGHLQPLLDRGRLPRVAPAADGRRQRSRTAADRYALEDGVPAVQRRGIAPRRTGGAGATPDAGGARAA